VLENVRDVWQDKMHNVVSTERMASGGKQEVGTAGEVEAQYDHVQRELLFIFIQLLSAASLCPNFPLQNGRQHT